MFCKNCGKELGAGAAICTECGFAKDKGEKFCPNCGSETTPGASVCTKCGAALAGAVPVDGTQKSKLVALLLAFFLGGFGVHNFYLGYTTNGIIQIVITLVTCGFGGWIWPIIDLIRLLTGSISKDAAGNELKKEF